MDYSFHLHQGLQLLEKQEPLSTKKALEHLKKANEMTEEGHVGKPKILYLLAYGNFLIGNIELSYRIAHKAKGLIDSAAENCIIKMDNMRQKLFCEDDIINLINHLNKEFAQVVLFIDSTDNDFDENKLDFSRVNQIFQTEEKEEIKPQFSPDNLDEELIMATFFGLGRTEDEIIYFDKLKGDVLSYVQGYLSSHLGDQSIANMKLANRILQSERNDFIDENRYVLIDRLQLSEFLKEYKKHTKGKEPFYSFVEYFSIEVLKDFEYLENLTIEDLTFTKQIQEEFHKLFQRKYEHRIIELKDEYSIMFKNTSIMLASNWIEQNIFDLKRNHHMQEKYGIDINNAHPKAIELIPEDFFWSRIDGLAPFSISNGGDTLLADFRDWRKENPTTPTIECLEQVIESVGEMEFTDYNSEILSRTKIQSQLENEDFDDQHYIYDLDHLLIATGFAQLVDEGIIESDNKKIIKLAIDRQIIWAELAEDWEHSTEYISNLKVLDRALKFA